MILGLVDGKKEEPFLSSIQQGLFASRFYFAVLRHHLNLTRPGGGKRDGNRTSIQRWPGSANWVACAAARRVVKIRFTKALDANMPVMAIWFL